MKYRFLSAIVIALAVATLFACGGKSSPAAPSTDGAGTTTVATPTTGGGTGRLTVSLKDSPFSDAQAVLVTFSEVSVHTSEGGWQPLTLSGKRTCDLKQLQTATALLGTAELPAGHYTQIRVVVDSATIYFDKAAPTGACVDGAAVIADSMNQASVTIPSGELKLNREFDLGAQKTVTILLDFDGDKSIHETGKGKYQMSPVISVVSVQ